MKNPRMQQPGKDKREQGSILAISSVAMLAVLLAVGMGVDISRFYTSKAELQNAADAAALQPDEHGGCSDRRPLALDRVEDLRDAESHGMRPRALALHRMTAVQGRRRP